MCECVIPACTVCTVLCWHEITKLADIADRQTDMFQHVAAIVIPIWRGAHCRLERCLTDNTTKAPSDCQRNQLNFATGCAAAHERSESCQTNQTTCQLPVQPIKVAYHESTIWQPDADGANSALPSHDNADAVSCGAGARWQGAAIWDMRYVCNNQINCRHRCWLRLRRRRRRRRWRCQLKWIPPSGKNMTCTNDIDSVHRRQHIDDDDDVDSW